jgi:tetratricopeptide (TPR) repeat protein
MFRRFSIVLQLFALSGCTSSPWQKIDLAERQGNLRILEQELLAYTRLNPTDPQGYLRLGDVYGRVENWSGMLDAFSKCEALDPFWKKHTQNLKELFWTRNLNDGIRAQRDGSTADARQYFRNATIILPEKPLSHRLHGEMAIAVGETTSAETSLRECLRLDEGDYRARTFLMRILFSRGHYQEAISEGEIILDKYEQDVDALRVLAYGYDALNDEAAAIEAYRALLLVSKNPADLESFAALRFKHGNYDAAVSLCRQAIQAGGDRLTNLRSIAQSQLMQQDFRHLHETAYQILEIRENDRTGLQLLRLAFAGLGDENAAKSTERRIHELTVK